MDEKITDSILFNKSIKEVDKLFKKISDLEVLLLHNESLIQNLERIIHLKNTFIYFLLFCVIVLISSLIFLSIPQPFYQVEAVK